MNNTFIVEDENGLTKEANIITSFDYKDKRYLLYSISKDDNNDNIFVSELIKDNDGFDEIIDIEDNSLKDELDEVVKELLNKIKEL